MPGRRRRPPFMQLLQFERGRIIGMMEMGASYSEISCRTGRSLRTIQHVCTQWTQEGTSTRRPGSGQPRATSECEDRHIVCTAVADQHHKSEQQSTAGDESHFCLQHNDGRQHVCRRSGERAHASTIAERHTGPTTGIIVWEAISYDSRHHDCPYVDQVIWPVVIPFMNTIPNGVFQQDNARPHTAVITRVALQHVLNMHWPARSPDLSAIEHMWNAMGQHIHAHAHPAATVAQLMEQVLQAWREIPQTRHPQPVCVHADQGSTVHRCPWWPHRVLSHPLPTPAER
ncbi:hypothetical protein ANN_19785 [Periplaneta americana]|uniref:Tc1-like transposase DDE domain-containing protein n=1 Tax=Periplaneta americana TaxID=6978 RepID=A0ABQ8SAV2_PERAM|nr:hypothetical protein ANN_19785 [Periplaneta americana]